MLKQAISIFPVLERLLRELKPYYLMWNIVFEFNAITSSIQSDQIKTLNYELLAEKFQGFHRDTQSLSILFTNVKNMAALGITEVLLERIIKAQ